MTIHEMREKLGMTQIDFAERYQIPFRTIQNWETGTRVPPDYVLNFLENQVRSDLINRRTIALPVLDPNKKNLPDRRLFYNYTSWLVAVKKCLGNDVVFALDEALMCQDNYTNEGEEKYIWIYGPDTALQYNGVVILSNEVDPVYVETKMGVSYTNFHRTLFDAISNECIYNPKGITEALRRYYFAHEYSFKDIIVAPRQMVQFEKLAKIAKSYYNK